MFKIISANILSKAQLSEIKKLEKECCNHESLNMKLNWDMLEQRSIKENNDFLCYINDKLVGFLGLYGIGPDLEVIELTGMVHHAHRGKGIFKELFNKAKEICSSRGIKRILLISERDSNSGVKFVKAINSTYSFSEYRMTFSGSIVSYIPNPDIVLREATSKNHSELNRIDSFCFDINSPIDYSDFYKDSIYIIKLNGESIGKIGVCSDGENKYIFGFGIKPEHRGKGFGKQVLCLTLSNLISQGASKIILEVEVKNENALSLYKKCGFKESTVYDYYEFKL